MLALGSLAPGAARAASVTAEGSWRVGPTVPAAAAQSGGQATLLPAEGSVVTLHPGQICDASGCLVLRLERAAPSRSVTALAAALHVGPRTPRYLVSISGQAAYLLVKLDRGRLAAGFEACDDALAHCGPAWQIWQPIGPQPGLRP